jgi:hypothetical protein
MLNVSQKFGRNMYRIKNNAKKNPHPGHPNILLYPFAKPSLLILLSIICTYSAFIRRVNELLSFQGPPIQFEGKTFMLADKFPVSDGDKLRISIERTCSQFVQGMTIDIRGYCEVQGKVFKEKKGAKLLFWEDAELIDPKISKSLFIPKKNLSGFRTYGN